MEKDKDKDECTKTEGCQATDHKDGCPENSKTTQNEEESKAACTKNEACKAEEHEDGCPKKQTKVACTKTNECEAEEHDAECPKYVSKKKGPMKIITGGGGGYERPLEFTPDIVNQRMPSGLICNTCMAQGTKPHQVTLTENDYTYTLSADGKSCTMVVNAQSVAAKWSGHKLAAGEGNKTIEWYHDNNTGGWQTNSSALNQGWCTFNVEEENNVQKDPYYEQFVNFLKSKNIQIEMECTNTGHDNKSGNFSISSTNHSTLDFFNIISFSDNGTTVSCTTTVDLGLCVDWWNQNHHDNITKTHALDTNASNVTTVIWTRTKNDGGSSWENSPNSVKVFVTCKITEPQTKDLTVTKVWADENNKNNTRPDSIQVNLKENGTTIETITLSRDNQWSYTKTGLSKDKNYSWEEQAVSNYNAAYSTKGNTTTITNTYQAPDPTPETKSLTVKKDWQDATNKYNARPTELKVKLKDGDTTVQTVTLNTQNNWTATVDNLEKDKNYTWVEESIPNYEKISQETDENGVTTITNGYKIPAKKQLTIAKTWEDTGHETERPEEIQVSIVGTVNGENFEGNTFSVTLKKSENWQSATIEVPNTYKGAIVSYTFTETCKFGENAQKIDYTSTQSGNGNTITFTNTYKAPDPDPEPETKKLTVKKTWDDAGNEDKRPASITFTATGKVDGKDFENNIFTATLQPDAQGKWPESVEIKVVKAVDGKDVVYTVTESKVTDYTSQQLDGQPADTFAFQNTYVDPHAGQIHIEGSKTWVDNDNAKGLRPPTIYIDLWAGDSVVASKKVTEADGWKWDFGWHPEKDAQGNKIDYEIREYSGMYYSSQVNGFDVTNTLKDTKEVVIKKEWSDGNDKHKNSTVTIEIDVTGPGIYEFKDEEKLDNEVNWTVSWILPKDAKVSIKEKNVPKGYTASYKQDGNTYTCVNTPKTHTIYRFTYKLLQTGQMNWPIPVLAVLGIGMLSAGVALVVQKKRGKYEH